MPGLDIEVKHANRKREAPWIGIGKSGTWSDVAEALAECGLDFQVRGQEAYTDLWLPGTVSSPAVLASVPVTVKEKVPGIMVNVREDNEKIVGVVSEQYGLIQNSDAFKLMQPFCDRGAVIRHGGMTAQGMCFLVAEYSEFDANGDEYVTYVCMMNSFNSRFPLALFVTPVRVICQNMFRQLVEGNENMLHIKHGSQINNRLEESQRLLASAAEYNIELQKVLGVAARTKLDPWPLVEELFPYPKVKGPKYQTSCVNVDEMREAFMNKYYMVSDNAKFEGTGMGFLNAYFDYLSHRPEPRGDASAWRQSRFSGLLSGQNVQRKLIDKAVGR